MSKIGEGETLINVIESNKQLLLHRSLWNSVTYIENAVPLFRINLCSTIQNARAYTILQTVSF